MATKAELEVELAKLKQQLAERPAPAENETLEDAPAHAQPDETEEVVDWDQELSEVIASVRDLPDKQPLLLALGAFAVGYLIGRAK